MAGDYKYPIDPGIIRASEAQRTAHAIKQQFGGVMSKSAPLRCEVTGNPPGTDEWPSGHPCVCRACNRPR
jgi:hypothetical protein